MAARRGLNSKGVWAAGGLAAVVLALTGYAMFGGGDEGSDAGKNTAGGGSSASAPAKPQGTYSAPEDWVEPKRWVSLPRGQRTNKNGLQLGFPHTAEGAVAQLVAANTTDVEGSTSVADVQTQRYDAYMSAADRSDANRKKIEQAAAKVDGQVRKKLGLPADGDLPSGAYVRSSVVGYQVVKDSADEVGVFLLARATEKAGETAPEQDSYTRTFMAARWEGGDWKLSSAATVALGKSAMSNKPAIAAPGDPAFNTAGWTAIREAS
ncbi:hypothetical protein QA942_39875 [Streptomyces sp. B21-106]|uniref:hypothetical protein n=1 Tax=Streptomyces sp. B21-106 TaxID=3039418 RepID=UPI002FF185AE